MRKAFLTGGFMPIPDQGFSLSDIRIVSLVQKSFSILEP